MVLLYLPIYIGLSKPIDRIICGVKTKLDFGTSTLHDGLFVSCERVGFVVYKLV